MQAAEGLSDAQAAVYDRQLRLWGHEVQRRLMTAKVLVIGGDGLAAEIAKNLVLAGVGHVSLADDTPVSQAAFGNFLVTSDASDSTTVAQASVQTLSAMNPLMSCTVTSLGGPCTSQQPLNLQPEQIAPFDLIISTCGLSSASADRLEQLCADTGKQLYIAEVVGPLAYAFMYLGPKFTYADKQEAAAEGPSKAPELKEFSYARLAPSLSRPVNKCIGRRPTHPLYQVLRVVRQYEAAHGMVPSSAADLPALLALAAELESSEGAPTGSISTELLDSWVLDREVVPHVAAAPVAAVAGGALANSALRAISRVGAPLKNWFFFTLYDGSGMVEDIGSA